MKILVVLTRFPYPLNKGDKLRAYNQIKELSKHNDIYLFALTDKRIKKDDYQKLETYCEDIHIAKLSLLGKICSLFKCLFSSMPLQVALFTSFSAKRSFYKYFSEVNPESAYFQFVRSAEYAKVIRKKRKNNAVRLVLDFQDCLSMNIFRRANVSNPVVKFLLMQEVKRLRKYEDSMFDLFDATSIITKQDRGCIMTQRRKETKIIENGVDKKYFEYDGNRKKRWDIIFSGNMSYKPNVVAAKYLINNIMPLVWKKNKDVTVCLAGSNPSKEVKALANDKVTVTGWVDDMRQCYAQSLIFVAPMQIGTGLQNKLLEAMAMMLPCVTTELAHCALKTQADEHLLVGNNEKELSAHILALLKNSSYRYNIAKAGNSFVKDNYSWSASTLRLEKLLSPVKRNN